MDSKAIRQAFLDFFEEKQHRIVSSAPMVIKNDPTLMFTNAGMNQFKDIFLGNRPAASPRAADTQKCLRVSGKHNDLEEVGHDTYHHTMFEMLGNWSFGDYFKQEAIDWAWEFLHDKMGIAADRMYATIFEGSEEDGVPQDSEAKAIWLKHMPEERIILGNKKDNFWEMGETGPCGPCSEIHVDIRDDDERAKVSGKDLVNKDHPQVIEIWNLVFMQFNRKADGKLESLPATHVDTGMGFERLCMVKQGKKSNYDTDVFQNTIRKIETLCGIKYGENEKSDIAMRVIADHLRAIAFAIADGQLPSNNKAGYVIRRILRRAVRYGYTFLNFREAFIYQLVEVLKETMSEAFPELISQQTLIEKVIKEEEESFLRTLATGINLLEKIIAERKSKDFIVVPGAQAFELYDTFGFPLDLTELILKENGLVVNREEFQGEMNKQKERARNAAAVETDDWQVVRQDDVEEFIGYDNIEADVLLTKYRKVKQQKSEFYQLVFNITPFYAESGGQVGDAGFIEANGEKIEIFDTKKENDLIIHLSKKLPSDINVTFKAVVNAQARQNTANNHTATHLLHAALREVLGSHVEQKGSLVHPDYLRFDFSHFQKVSEEDLAKVEKIVNAKIRENISLEENRAVPHSKALEMGAMALFGEKYGDLVRVIKFGESVELCGGTHTSATGNIGFFKIFSESSTAAGIRRIEAVSGEKAEEMIGEHYNMLKNIGDLFKNNTDLLRNIESLIQENSAISKQMQSMSNSIVAIEKRNLIDDAKEYNGVKIVSAVVKPMIADQLKNLAFGINNELENAVVVLGGVVNDKPQLAIYIAENLVAQYRLNAGQIVREAGKKIQGGGGGQAFFATAGGKNADGLHYAIEDAVAIIKNAIGA
ncbi:MAG: alanine--tRNA ligase [Mangrovibacterium sp.]